MAMAIKRFSVAILLLTAGTLFAGTNDDLMSSVKKRWPAKKEGVIVCNRQASKEALQSLMESATKAGYSMVLIDVQDKKDVDRATGTITRSHPDFVVLLDTDPTLGKTSSSTEYFIYRVGMAGVPTVATSSEMVKLGADLGPDGPTKG